MRNNNKLTIVLYIFLISLIMSFFLIKYYGDKYGKLLLSYGEKYATRIITLVVNNSISVDNNDLFIIDKINNDIKSINLDNYKANILVNKMNNKINNYLNSIENGNISDIDLKGLSNIEINNLRNGFIYYVPIGNLTGNGLLSNIGPSIPIKLIIINDVISDLDSNIKEYGINNAMIEVRIKVKVNVLVSALFISKNKEIEISRVIMMKVIQGNIPDYFINNKN